MAIVKNICTQMSATPHIMTFSDITKALGEGAVMGQKVKDPLTGAVLNLSYQASRRALSLTEKLLHELYKQAPIKDTPIPARPKASR